MSTSERLRIPAYAASVVLIAWLDLRVAPGGNISVLYLLPLFVSFLFDRRRTSLVLAAAATTLTLIALLAPIRAPSLSSAVSPLLAVAAFWGATLTNSRLRRMDGARAHSDRLRQAAERQAEESSKALRDLKQAIDQASIVAITDQRGVISYVNDKFCEISKYSRDELVGQDHRIINSSHHPKDFIRDLWRTIAQGRVWQGEIRNRAKDGSYYWVDTTIVPFIDERGKPYQYLAIRNDITARKAAEERLVSQASLARLGELAAVVAHEVRNPLAGLRGALQILQQRLGSERGEHAVIVEMIKRLDALNDRVSDLLLYAKPRAPRLARLGLRSLLDATAQIVQRDPVMAGITFEITGDDVAARGDGELLREVFLNLMLNAGQAMDGHGTVQVQVRAASQAIVTVRDRGQGIPPERQEAVFEPFYTSKRSGTGLGLAIVRRLLDLQSGSIAIESSSPAGTTMLVTLPLDSVTSEKAPAKGAVAHDRA
jgi:PAS domain S-box-containing protein